MVGVRGDDKGKFLLIVVDGVVFVEVLLLKGIGLFSSFKDNGIGLGGESFCCGFYNLLFFEEDEGNYDDSGNLLKCYS